MPAWIRKHGGVIFPMLAAVLVFGIASLLEWRGLPPNMSSGISFVISAIVMIPVMLIVSRRGKR